MLPTVSRPFRGRAQGRSFVMQSAGGVAPVVCILAGRLPGPRAGRTINHTERPDA